MKGEQGRPDPQRLVRENEQLRREVIERDKKIDDLNRQIAGLERQLGLRHQNSTTSSKPPSSDGLAGGQRKRGSGRKKSRRRPGGQPGHLGGWRGLAPLSRVNEVKQLFASRCRHCDCLLSPRMPVEGGARRHQVTELPAMEAHITEYHCQKTICPDCGETTQAQLPAEAQGQFGPRLTALIAYLTMNCHMPRRVLQDVLAQVLDIPLSLGSVQKCWEEVSDAVAEPCAELERQLPHEPVLNSDETGYRTSGAKRWLWALVALRFVFCRIATSRGAEVLTALLGDVFEGILCSDRCANYRKYHKGEGQFCWAHFKRNLLGVQELGKTTDAERFCRDALALHARLFRLWHRFRDGPGVRYGPITRQQLIEKSIPLEKKFFALADRYADSHDRHVASLALALLKHFERFFAFLRHEGVEPANNSAERALRCAVQWRKISFGCRSPLGEVAVARLLTAVRTCKMQNRPPLDYLVNAIRSHRRALPVPSLL